MAKILGQVQEGTFTVQICNPLPRPVQLKSICKLVVLSVVEDSMVEVVGKQVDLTDVMACVEGHRKENDILEDMLKQAEDK